MLTSLFPALPDDPLCYPPPPGQRAEQFELGHDGQVIAHRGPELIEEEPQALDDRGTHFLVGAALLLVRLHRETVEEPGARLVPM